MKRIFIIPILLYFAICTNAQKSLYSENDFKYIDDIYLTEYFSVDSFPDLFKYIIPAYLDSWRVDTNDVTFTNGYKVDLKKYLYDYNYYYSPNGILPEYMLHYNFHNLKLGIQKYIIKIDMDGYGQIIDINIPKPFDYKLLNYDKAITIADSIFQIQNFQYDEKYVDLRFDRSENELLWKFHYSIEDTIKGRFNGQEYDSILKTRSFNIDISTKRPNMVKAYKDTLSIEQEILEEE
ncbi:hypothetical protein [Saccharicrinis sp. FJH54]